MINRHLNVAAIMALASMPAGMSSFDSSQGRPATPEQRQAKADEKAFGAEEAIAKAKEKAKRKKKRNKLLVKLKGLN